MTRPDALALELDSVESRSSAATLTGAAAFARLLQLAEQRDSGQIVRVVRFIAATYNGQAFGFDPFDLRAVDIAIGDDMLACLVRCAGAALICTGSWRVEMRECAR